MKKKRRQSKPEIENSDATVSTDAERTRLLEEQESGSAQSQAYPDEAEMLEGTEAALDVDALDLSETAGAGRERGLAEEYLEHLQRLQAEFANYRKRALKEIRESCDAGKAELTCKMLPVLDDFERALANLKPDCSGDEALKGVTLIYEKLRSILEAEGLESLRCEGEIFDPHVHEAVVVTRVEDGKEGEILQDFQKGYVFKGKLIRPSKVQVAQVEKHDD
jgi:molecular chaperone GrpE